MPTRPLSASGALTSHRRAAGASKAGDFAGEEKLLSYEEENHRLKRELADNRDKIKQLTSKLAYAERRVKTAATGPRSGAAGRSTRIEDSMILRQVQAEDDAALLDQRLRESERQLSREKERVALFRDRAKEYKAKLNDTLKKTRIGVYGTGAGGGASKSRVSMDESVNDQRARQKIADLQKEVEFLRAQAESHARFPSSASKAKKMRKSLRFSSESGAVGQSREDPFSSPARSRDDMADFARASDGEAVSLMDSPYFNADGVGGAVMVGDVEMQPLHIDGFDYLVDYTTSYVYRVPQGKVGPRLVGVLKGGKLQQTSLADVFESKLDEYLRKNKIFLEQLFKDFDSNGDGRLDASEMQALLQEVMPGLSVAHVRFLQSFLDINNDSLSLNEFKTSIQECASLSHNLKTADAVPELYTLLEKLRDYIEANRSTALTAFRELDRDNSGYLENGELLDLIGRLLPGLSPQQKRLMLGKIHQMDLDGNSKISFKEFVRTLGLIKVVRPSPSSVVSRVISRWVLHEYRMEGVGQTYWVDKTTARVYVPSASAVGRQARDGHGPVLVGRFLEGAVRILSDESSYRILEKALKRRDGSGGEETLLEKKFNRFCESESTTKLPCGDVAKFLTGALQEVSVGAANMVQALCCSNHHAASSAVRTSAGSAVKEREAGGVGGGVTFLRLVSNIKEAVALMTDQPSGGKNRNKRQAAVLDALRAFINREQKTLFLIFQKLDHGSGRLTVNEVVRAVSEAIPDLNEFKNPEAHRALIAVMTSLDIDGIGKLSYDEVYNACGVRNIKLVQFSSADHASAPSPAQQRWSVPSMSSTGFGGASSTAELSKLQEENQYLRVQLRKLSAVEEELTRARRELSENTALNNFADVDRMIMACEQEGLPDLKEAWERVDILQKRYQEAHVALSVLKANHTRMLSQLEETHAKLNEECRKNRAMEASGKEMQLQLEAALELRPLLDAAQQEQLRLRKENEQLAASVIDAPADAMSKVNQLSLALAREQRERAAAELREAEARRMAIEAADRGGAGNSGDSVSMLRKERDAARAESHRLQLDLEQLTEKLKVYSSGNASSSLGPDVAGQHPEHDEIDSSEIGKPDAEKSTKTLIAELHFARDQYSVLHSELLKTTKLLRIEEAQTCDLKADIHDIEEANAQRVTVLTRKVTSLERELDRRCEKLRKAEAQLRRMFNKGMNDENDVFGSNNLVVRSLSGRPPSPSVRESSASLLDELREGENVLEFHVESAELNAHAFAGGGSIGVGGGAGAEPSTFLTWDFFEHQTQATSVQTGLSPTFSYTVQYVVKMDPFFVEYLDTRSVRVELNIANGLDFKTVGAATIGLRGVLDDYSTGHSFTRDGGVHYAEIIGAGNHVLGRIRYRAIIKFPFSSVLKEYYELKEAADSSKRRATRYGDSAAGAAGGGGADQVLNAIAQSSSGSQSNSFLRVTIKACEGLVKRAQDGSELVPYVSYQVPSHPEHDTILGHGSNVVLNDVAEFPMARTPPLMERLRSCYMDICVFDDADNDLSEAGVVGLGKVSLESLADGLPIDGKVFIYSLSDGEKCTGAVMVDIKWVNMFEEKQDGAAEEAQRRYQDLAGSVDRRRKSGEDALTPRHLDGAGGTEIPAPTSGTGPQARGSDLEVLSVSYEKEMRPSRPVAMSVRESLRRSREAGLSKEVKIKLGDQLAPSSQAGGRYATSMGLQDSVDLEEERSSRHGARARVIHENPDTAILLKIKSVTLLGNVILDDTRIKSMLLLFELFLNDSGQDQWTSAVPKSRTMSFDYVNAFDLSPHTEVGSGNRRTIVSMVRADAAAQSASTVPFVLVSEGDPRGEDGYYEIATSSSLDMRAVLKAGRESYETTLEMEDDKGDKVALLLVEVKIGRALTDLMI